MELREWLIILGLVLVVIIVIDGARRYRKQRSLSRFDQGEQGSDQQAAGKAADWELPNGGARIIESARVAPPESLSLFERRGLKTKLPFARALPADGAHHGSRARQNDKDRVRLSTSSTPLATADYRPSPAAQAPVEAAPGHETRGEPKWDVDEFDDPAVGPDIHDEPHDDAQRPPRRSAAGGFDGEEEHADDPRYEGLSEIIFRRPMDGVARLQEAAAERRRQRAIAREEARVRRLEARARRAEERALRKQEKERQAEALRQKREEERSKREARSRAEQERRAESQPARFDTQRALDDDDDPLFAPRRHDDDIEQHAGHYAHPDAGRFDHNHDRDPWPRGRERGDELHEERQRDPAADYYRHADHPDLDEWPAPEPQLHPVIERALRHQMAGRDALQVLGEADEVLVINVVARDGERFQGIDLLQLLLACGLRYAPEGGLFHRFETELADSPLQFSVVNALKPGSFPVEQMESFSTRGVSFLMPLPSADDSSGAFDAMFETAKVVVRNLKGELRDEQQSVMTAQTVEFTRQRVREFERRMRLHRQSR